MPKKATVVVHPAYVVGDISPRLFSAFLEPIGNMVNGTMFNPKHPTADSQGFRTDFIDALKGTGLPAIRLPGGNFVSGWRWQDSIGPMEKRKAHLDLAWFQYVPNDVGHDEYLQWAEKVGSETMYTINLGTGTLNDAIDITEYTNHSGGTYWSDLRKEYGHEKPYGVKTWYLGNEMDGPWQIATWQKDPRGYGVLANEVSKVMKQIDGKIETAVCGSSSPFMAHFPQWEHDVIEQCYEAVDYLSVHHYHPAPAGDFGAFMAGSNHYENFLRSEINMLDYVGEKLRSPRKIMLSLDEYGSSMRQFNGTERAIGRERHNWLTGHYRINPDREFIRHDPSNMGAGRMGGFRRPGDMYGALSAASIMLMMVRMADRVKIGCATGGLGALAAASQDGTWRAASYYSYSDMINYAKGTSLHTAVDCDTYDVPGYIVGNTAQYADLEGVQFIETAAAMDGDELNIFVVNRNWEASNLLDIDLRGFGDLTLVEHKEMFTEDMDARNSLTETNVAPTVNKDSKLENGYVKATVKPLSWNVFRLKKN